MDNIIINNQKLISELEYVGLNKKSAIIYAAMLEFGGAYPSKIAEKTRLNRSTVYKILDDLAIRELVNRIKKGKKFYYQINQPKKLLYFSKRQIEISNTRFERAKKLLPELEVLVASLENKPRVRFFEGINEVLNIYLDHVDVKEPYEMLAYSNTAGVLDFMPVKFRDDYVKKKERIGITTRGIVPDTEKDANYSKIAYGNIKKEKILPKLKFIPASIFPYKNEITIYSFNKISIINFEKEVLVGVIIEDKDIHNMMKMIFELAWQGVKV